MPPPAPQVPGGGLVRRGVAGFSVAEHAAAQQALLRDLPAVFCQQRPGSGMLQQGQLMVQRARVFFRQRIAGIGPGPMVSAHAEIEFQRDFPMHQYIAPGVMHQHVQFAECALTVVNHQIAGDQCQRRAGLHGVRDQVFKQAPEPGIVIGAQGEGGQRRCEQRPGICHAAQQRRRAQPVGWRHRPKRAVVGVPGRNGWGGRFMRHGVHYTTAGAGPTTIRFTTGSGKRLWCICHGGWAALPSPARLSWRVTT